MENQERPRQITPSHLARRAIVYIRQSSEIQVREHQGSTMYQREQVRFPIAWGWAPERIDEIDEDLGKSATSTIHRRGYQRMLAALMSGQVGAIFVADLNRLCRNFRDAVILLDECMIHNVVVVVDGRPHDLSDRSDRLVATMNLNVSEFENDGRRETMRNGRFAKAAKGLAVSSPPAGYVAKKGRWEKDPVEQVRVAIAVVFAAILQHRSLVKAVRYLVSIGFKLPRRKGLDLEWVDPDVGKLSFIARSRAYAGDYIFRRKRVDAALGRRGNGRLKERLSLPEEMFINADHHDPYVSRTEWDEIQHLLDVNAPKNDRRNLGPGPAVLQGLIRCDRHRRHLMSPRLKNPGNGTKYSYYACPGERLLGGECCYTIAGPPLERLVVEAIAHRFSAPSLELVRDCWRLARRSALDQHRRRELEVERVRERVKYLKRRHEQVDPSNKRVAAAVESQFEAAMRDLETAEARDDRTEDPLSAFTEKAFEEVLSLCPRFSAMWHDPETPSHVRKEIVRTVISEVIIESVTLEQIHARIRWAGGGPDQVVVIQRPAYALRLIAEMAAKEVAPQDIAAHLTSLGLMNRKGAPWTPKSVAGVVGRARRNAGRRST